MSKKRAIFTLLFVFFCSVFSTFAQNTTKEKLPLETVLKILEERYKTHFSYLDQTIANKKLLLPDEELTLEDAVDLLENETNLDFIIVDATSIVISNKSNPFASFITQKLEEVVITNYLTQGISKKSDGKVVIKTEDFGILPGLIEPDILQTIQALPAQ